MAGILSAFNPEASFFPFKKLKERCAVWESTFVFEGCIAVLLGRVGILLGVVNPLRKDPDFLNSGHILLVIRRLLDIRLL